MKIAASCFALLLTVMLAGCGVVTAPVAERLAQSPLAALSTAPDLAPDYTKTIPADCTKIDGTFWFTTGYSYDATLGMSTVSCDAAATDWMNNGARHPRWGTA